MKLVLLFILCLCFYTVGRLKGETETTKLIKQYIEQSKDWNEFLKKYSILYKDNVGD